MALAFRPAYYLANWSFNSREAVVYVRGPHPAVPEMPPIQGKRRGRISYPPADTISIGLGSRELHGHAPALDLAVEEISECTRSGKSHGHAESAERCRDIRHGDDCLQLGRDALHHRLPAG